MTKDEREVLIARLQRENDESRAEIARRKTEREENPAAFDVAALADRRVTGVESDLAYGDIRQPEPSPPVAKSGEGGGLVYKTTETAQAAAPRMGLGASSGDDEWKGWNDWVKAHIANDRADLVEQLTKAIGEVIATMREECSAEIKAAIGERDIKIAKLEAQVELLLRMYVPAKTGEVVEIPKGIMRKVHDNG